MPPLIQPRQQRDVCASMHQRSGRDKDIRPPKVRQRQTAYEDNPFTAPPAYYDTTPKNRPSNREAKKVKQVSSKVSTEIERAAYCDIAPERRRNAAIHTTPTAESRHAASGKRLGMRASEARPRQRHQTTQRAAEADNILRQPAESTARHQQAGGKNKKC